MNPFNVAVIGCGAISGNHFHALEKLDTARLTAVCDINAEKANAAADAQHVRACTDWQALIQDPGIDAVHLCVPHWLHRPMAVAALRAGKHVLCEKPMGMNADEAAQMAAAARETGKALTVCFQNRYNPASRRMKALIDSGALGAFLGGSAFVVWNRGEQYYQNCDWRGRWRTEGGSVLINQAIHTLDLINWLSGGLRVTHGRMSAHRLAQTIETEDTCELLLSDAAGHRCLFYASNCGVNNLPVQLHLTFEQGELHMDGSRLTVKTPDMTALEDYSAQVKVGKDYWGSGHGPFIEDFYRRLQAGEAPAIPPEDALRTMRLMDEAYRADTSERRRPDNECDPPSRTE